MTHSKRVQTARWISAGLLTLLVGTGLYGNTIGARWPTSETLPVWGFEAAYALAVGVLHFLTWPLWRSRVSWPGQLPSR